MPRKLRDLTPGRYHLITIRTNLAQIWMLPVKDIEEMIGGVLARYQEIFKVEIFAYIFLGNHYHIVCNTPENGIDQFFENVNREIARRINRRYGRTAKFWARPYDDAVILSEKDLLEAVLYTVTNPVRHGLIRHTKSWPSLGSYHHILNEKDRRFTFTHFSIRNDKGHYLQTIHQLQITRLPQFKDMNADEYAATLYAYISDREEMLAAERVTKKQGFLGAKNLRKQKPGAVPKDIARSVSPICYTKDAKIRSFYREERRVFRAAYRLASILFRAGKEVRFPLYCHRPPLHKDPACPRRADFKRLGAESSDPIMV